jgi:hypothetical protein
MSLLITEFFFNREVIASSDGDGNGIDRESNGMVTQLEWLGIRRA